MRLALSLCVVALVAIVGVPALAPRASQAAFDGVPRVVDGDSLEIGGVSLRLHGIDAPEMGQSCVGETGAFDCGAWSRAALATRIGAGAVACTQIDYDSRYNRPVVRCLLGDVDLNAAMVADGYAVAYRRYSQDYVRQEAAAQAARRGIWALEMDRPEDYRHHNAPQAAAVVVNRALPVVSAGEATGACDIKGNISGNGRIYHLPGQAHYDETRISTSRGERWFCSEAEAQAAGWRRARR